MEFRLILFFFLHWHKIIPRNINYCENRGFFAFLQNTVLALLRITQYWPKKSLDDFVRRRLIHLLKRSFSEYPAFMEKLGFRERGNLLERFSALPIMTKERLRVEFSEAIQRYKKRDRLLIGKTSGITGIPMRVGVTEKFEVQYRIIRRRLFELAGLKPEDEFIYPRTTPNPHFCSRNVFIRRDLESLIDSHDDFFDLIRGRNIVAIYAFPTLLLLLEEIIIKNRIAPPQLKALITAGEDLSPVMRRSLENTFGTKVFNFYASIEFSSIGQECEYHNGLHINQEFHLIEILSAEGTPVGTDTWGRIVITPLDLSIVPIFHYDTGDIGMLLSKPCLCGRTLPRLRIRGRSPDVIVTPHGVISPFAFKEMVDGYNPELFEKIKRYQLIVEDDARLVLLIVPSERFADKDAQTIEKICKKFLRGRIDFEVRTANSVEYVGLKAPFLIRKKIK